MQDKKAEGWLQRRNYREGEVWLFCYYTHGLTGVVEECKTIGLVRDHPREEDAWRQAEASGLCTLNQPSLPNSPTVAEIAQDWRDNELKRNGPLSKRASETVTTHESMLDGYILPKWGKVRAIEISVPMVERWFEDLSTTANNRHYPEGETPPKGYRAKPLEWPSIQKIRSTFSLLYAHALRHKLITGGKEINPFRHPRTEGGVRCIAVSDYEATVVAPEQMIDMLEFLNTPTTQMEWTLALLHAVTAMRPEEGFALKWRDIDWVQNQINISRAWSKGAETKGKNNLALAPVPMHPVLANFLRQWRAQSPYWKDEDWIFPSLTSDGRIPRSASTAAKDYLRPAAVYAGVIEEGSSKRFGWHNLRHSLAEFLAGKVDAVVTMKLLRHKRLATAAERYQHKVTSKQRNAQGMFLKAIGKMGPSGVNAKKKSTKAGKKGR
jgi:integrase